MCFFMFICLEFFMITTNNVCVIRKPAVIMIVGVNGGGKTTSLGMFDNKLDKCTLLFRLVKIILP